VPPQLLSWHVDSQDGQIVVIVSGALVGTVASALYRTLIRCLAREPAAILVELSGMSVAEPDAVKIFAMITQQAEVWPGTPFLLCTGNPATAALIGNEAPETLQLFETVADAQSALTGHDSLISELILPVAGAARRARDILTEACLRWDVPHLIAPTALVASELVTNAVVHARTILTLQMRLRPRHLYLAVFDGSDTEPVTRDDHGQSPGGRGLPMVEAASTRWGYLRRTTAKSCGRRSPFDDGAPPRGPWAGARAQRSARLSRAGATDSPVRDGQGRPFV
jgi:hypothetical protein